MILDLVLISFLFQKPALPNKLTSIDMYLLLSINSANYAFVLNLCKAQAPFHGQEAVAGCHTRLCSAIVIQRDLESWVYDCPQPHGGGEETDGGERERASESCYSIQLTFSSIISSPNISQYCVAQVYSSLLSLFSSPARHK